MADESREVVVVGGGPAGVAAALFLRQQGRDVLLLDEARFPRDKVCGEAVSPEGWRLLAAMGADAAVRALRPRPVRGMRLVSPDGTAFQGDYPAGREPGFALRREVLDAALLGVARAAGVEVREGARVTAVLRDGGTGRAAGAVRGILWENGAGPASCRARLVVGADGRRSVVARSLGLLREHRRLRRFAVRGHWEGMEGLGEHGEMHVGGGGYCGVAPLSATQANVAFVLDAGALRAAAGDLSSFYESALATRWPRVGRRLQRARLLAPPRAIGPLALDATGLCAPGLMLVGDAAGFYDPFTGEGLTLALRSAEIASAVAGPALDRGRTLDLSEYERRRRAATRDKFRFNRLVQRLVAWPALADAIARRLARRPDLADRLVGIAGDFVPAGSALTPRFVWDVLLA